jgi:hypothetical protein
MLCILGASLVASSQDKSFDLSNYKFPDYIRHELEFNFNSNGNGQKNTSESPNYSINGVITKYDYSSFNSQSSATLDYIYNYLTRKRIDYLHTNISGNYNYSTSNDIDNKVKDSNPDFTLTLNGSRTLYLNENKFFLEGMTDVILSQDNSHQIVNNQNYKTFADHLDLSVSLGVGTGRMEMVSDLWQAYYILEKLKQQKSLSKELTNDNVYEFAYQASRLKNKRFFDARLRKIAELQSLDSLLHQQGLIADTEISYFTTLNDYWSYGNFQDRQSGRVLKFWISPEYERQYNKTNGNTSGLSYKTSLVSNISYNCTKQLNLYWERHLNASLSNETRIDTTGKAYNSYPKNKQMANVNYGYGFFPDSRTYISGNLGYTGQTLFVPNSTSEELNQWINMVYINFNGYYYLSPQLQITGSFNLNYSDKEYTISNNVSTSYNLGLRYAIF